MKATVLRHWHTSSDPCQSVGDFYRVLLASQIGVWFEVFQFEELVILAVVAPYFWVWFFVQTTVSLINIIASV